MFQLREYCERTSNAGELTSFRCIRTVHIEFGRDKFAASGAALHLRLLTCDVCRANGRRVAGDSRLKGSESDPDE